MPAPFPHVDSPLRSAIRFILPDDRLREALVASLVRSSSRSIGLFVVTRRCGTRNVSRMTTPEELFDVVDDWDHVTGQLPRSEVHRRKLRHRAVHIFVFRSDRTMLIHRRTDDKEEFPGVWTSSASGHVSAGESYEESADRELTEELGFTAPLTRRHKFDACPSTSMEFTELYTCLWDGDVAPDPGEIAEIEWGDPSEIDRRIVQQPDVFSPAFRLLFQWHRRHF